MNHNYVCPEHLLLALIKEGEGVAYTILNNLNVDFERLSRELMETLSGEEVKELKQIRQRFLTPHLHWISSEEI